MHAFYEDHTESRMCTATPALQHPLCANLAGSQRLPQVGDEPHWAVPFLDRWCGQPEPAAPSVTCHLPGAGKGPPGSLTAFLTSILLLDGQGGSRWSLRAPGGHSLGPCPAGPSDELGTPFEKLSCIHKEEPGLGPALASGPVPHSSSETPAQEAVLATQPLEPHSCQTALGITVPRSPPCPL